MISRQQQTLLIVDDSPEDRELYRRYLLRDPEYSYNFWEASLGEEGLDLWQQHQPDAVLLDYRLPDLDGLEFLTKLQSLIQQPCLPVIMVTGLGNEAIAVQAIKAGAQDYLVKGSITPEGLHLAVKATIERVLLQTELQQRLDRERVIAHITRKIHQTLDLQEILQTTVTEVRQFLGIDRVLVFQLQPDDNGVVIAESVGSEWNALLGSTIYDPCLAKNYREFNQQRSVTYDRAFNEDYLKSYRQGQVTAIPNIHDSNIDPCHIELLTQFQVKANLVVPILHDDQFWGLLIVHHCTKPRTWKPLEIDLLKELAINVSIALRQAELYQQSQTELRMSKHSAKALQDSEERFRQLAENIDAVFWIKEVSENRVSYVSSAYERLWELDPQALYQSQQAWIDYIHPDDRESIDRAFREQAAAGLFDAEYRIILPDGSVRWVHDRCFPLANETGEIYRFTGITQDITDRKQAAEALQQSETFNRRILESISDCIKLLNLEGQLLYMNPGGLCLMKIDDFSPYINLEYAHLWPQENRSTVEGAIATAKAGETARFQGFCPTATGIPKWWDVIITPILNSEAQIIQLLAISRDITERKQSEEALQQSEERFRTLADNMSQFAWMADAKGEIFWYNQRWFDYTGTTLEEMQGWGWQKVHHPDHVDRVVAHIRHCFATGQLWEDTFPLRRQDGEYRWFLSRAIPIKDDRDRIICWFGTNTDIDDRKQIEEALRQSEERYRCLAELIPQLVWTANAAGSLLDVNQRWLDYTGLTIEQAHTLGWEQVIHPEDTPILAQQWAEAVNMGIPYQAEGRMRRADGVYRWHLHQAIGQTNEQGEIIKWFGTATDIEAQKQLECERHCLLLQEQTAREVAERANRIKDEFLAILSHELRSPLNPILGWAKLMQNRKFDEARTAEALATIERNARLQTQLIDDLLDVAKILRGKLSMNVAPVDLIFVIESAIDTVRAAAVAKEIIIHPVLPQIGQVSGDPARLQQIVWNLLSNAIKFTPAKGKVEIRLEKVGNQAQITVSDTGKGIKPDFLPYIFESFRQEDASTTRKYGGLGLGLAIVRHLVEASGGRIWVDSKGEGQGATFTIQLPLLDTEILQTQEEEVSPDELDLLGIRVLAVDDELDARELLTVLLTEYGAEVLTVTSATEALANLESFQPDVLVSDIGMPEMDGYSLIQQIRALPPEKGGQIRAIALTAYAREGDYQRAIASGYQLHITKPLEPEQLVRAVMVLIRDNN